MNELQKRAIEEYMCNDTILGIYEFKESGNVFVEYVNDEGDEFVEGFDLEGNKPVDFAEYKECTQEHVVLCVGGRGRLIK